jgi:hypothetical protein
MNSISTFAGQSLDTKDRRMLLIALGAILALILLVAVFTPATDPTKNRVPSSYLPGIHGAKAAFTLLQKSGYNVERWEQPLSVLATHANSTTVVILAQPSVSTQDDENAIRDVLLAGGRVLATGLEGGGILPRSALTEARGVSFAACESQPEGLAPLAGNGPVWIVPLVAWQIRDPDVRAAYTCAGQPVVVEYPVGKGEAIWWASSTPLENGSISRGQNLELLLNSVGPAEDKHVYWDESLHGQVHTQWDYTKGPILPLLVCGGIGLMVLVVFSFSRRSGPIRPLPQVARTTPIEFLDALGALYRSTAATSTAVQVALERFRAQAALFTGQRTAHLNAEHIVSVIERRFGSADDSLRADLAAAEAACWDEKLKPRHALKLIQALRRHEESFRAAAGHRTSVAANSSYDGARLSS